MKFRELTRTRMVLLVTFSLFNSTWAKTGIESCGSLGNGNNGPFDYRTERGQRLKIVEEFHFTSNIESLIRGNSASLGGELNYTLSAFPNHHRALLAFERLAEKSGENHPSGAKYELECYFLRAIIFRPDDTTARMIYANFLSKKNRELEAILQIEEGLKIAEENGFAHYQAGLIFLKIKNYAKARLYARKAESLNIDITTLRTKLAEIGQWEEIRAAIKPIEPILGE